MALLAVFICLAAGATVLSMQRARWQWTCSTHNAGPRGCKALFLMLEELGHDPQRWGRPFGKLTGTGNVLFLIAPSKIEADASEAKRLLNWVSEGNLLVFASIAGDPFSVRLRERRLLDALKIGSGMEGMGGSGPLADGARPWALTEGVHAKPVPDEPYQDRVRSLYFDRRKAVCPDAAEWTHLCARRGTSFAARRPWGKGAVVFLTNTGVLRNQTILEGDNAYFLVNLVDARGGGQVLFDEYHHGYITHALEGDRSALRGVGLFYLQLLLAAVVYVWARAPRLGRPVPLAIERPRSSLEFVRAMADVYSRAKVDRYALDFCYLDLRRALMSRMGLSQRAEDASIRHQLARRDREAAGDLADALDAYRHAAASPQTRPGEILRICAKFAKIERASES